MSQDIIDDEERLLPYKRPVRTSQCQKKSGWKLPMATLFATMNPIPAEEEEQGNPLYLRVATLVPETPLGHENEEEYSVLAMDLLQVELIQTSTLCLDVRLGVGSSELST